MTSPITRSVALVAWAAAAFSLICVVLINIGGVSSPINLSSRSHLGNPGFELLQVCPPYPMTFLSRQPWTRSLLTSRSGICPEKEMRASPITITIDFT